MPTPFPGMDPYLERRGLWEEIHTDLIARIRQYLIPLLRPKYRVGIEQRTYLSLVSAKGDLIGKPDIMVTTPMPSFVKSSAPVLVMAEPMRADTPLVGELPTAEEVTERYLEIRDTTTHEVITAIEILSPTNKESQEGRQQYENKRRKVLASATSLVEIDLLRAGKPFAMKVSGVSGDKPSDYRIVVSRSWQRPSADIYLFSVRQHIPSFLIPLRVGEQEPVLPLNQILHELYDQGGYDMAINYGQPADPPLSVEDVQWVAGFM